MISLLLVKFGVFSFQFIDAEKNVQTPCCIMIANNKIVVALEEPRKCTYRLLSKASVRDLVSVLVDPIASNFVMLVSYVLLS